MIKSSDGRTLLREPRAEDAYALQELRNDLELQTSLLSLGRPNPAEKVRGWVEAIHNDPASVFFVIACAGDGRFVGFIQVRAMDFVDLPSGRPAGEAVTGAMRCEWLRNI